SSSSPAMRPRRRRSTRCAERTPIASSSAGSPATTRSTTCSAMRSTPETADASLSPGESRTLEVAVHGGALAVECAGTGRPLVLLHGWALDRRVWDPQMALANRFRLVAIDRRGFGRSSAPPDLNREVADVVAVRDALGLDRIVLVGMSQGGRVALHYALGDPESVAAIVLQGAPLDGFLPAPRHADAIP